MSNYEERTETINTACILCGRELAGNEIDLCSDCEGKWEKAEDND